MSIYEFDSEEEYATFVNWIEAKKPSITDCSIETFNDDLEDFDRLDEDGLYIEYTRVLLDNLNVTKSMDLMIPTHSSFEFSQDFHLDAVRLRSCFGRNNLFNFHCKEIEVSDSEISSENVNQYLRAWAAGCYNELEKLEVLFYGNENKFDWKPLLQGLNRKRTIYEHNIIDPEVTDETTEVKIETEHPGEFDYYYYKWAKIHRKVDSEGNFYMGMIVN